MADSDDAARQQILFWLAQFERWTASAYGTLDMPADLINEAKLRGIRLGVDAKLVGLNGILKSLSVAMLQSVIEQHVEALQSLKLLRDDLLLVEIERLRSQKLKPGELPARIAEARKAHEAFLKNWITFSPGVDQRMIKWFWPNMRNAKNLPELRDNILNLNTAPEDLRSPIDLARSGIRSELPKILSDAKNNAFSPATSHWIGIAYVLAQIELAQRFTNDRSRERDVWNWYEHAAIPADLIRELLGAFDKAILEATRDGNVARVEMLNPIRRRFVGEMALYYGLPSLECATLAAFQQRSGFVTDVVGVNRVTEKVTARPGLVRIDRSVSRDEMLGYTAVTGFPLIYPLREVEVPPGRPVLRWNRVAQLILARSWREASDHRHQALFFVSETAVEQHELVEDLLALDPVRKALAPSLKKRATIALTDRATRGKALAAVVRSLPKGVSNDQIVTALVPLIQRYLTYFTHHTGDNVRDFGKPYLDSTWPTDLSGRLFYDCGVYAVEAAFDLMRAAQAAGKLVLEFRFLVFPGHVALVVYQGQTSFAVNNARIFPPRPFPKAAAGQSVRDAAGFSWAPPATQDAFSARYAIVPVSMPLKTVSSNQSEAAFKKAIWAMYQLITGFDIAAAVGKQYFDSAKAFDIGSAILLFYFDDLSKAGKPEDRKADLNAVTILALALYDLADVLAVSCNFVDTRNARYTTTIAAHVNTDDELVLAGGLGATLTMYRAVDLVNQLPERARSADQKTLAAKPTRADHVDALTAALGASACTASFMRALAQRHVAAQAKVKQALDAAPDRIKGRFASVELAVPATSS